jgi:hypothetical protein
LVQHVVHPRRRTLGKARVRQIAFEEFDARQMSEVVPFARNEVVSHADVLSASKQLFRQMRTDETRAPRDQIRSHDSTRAS